MIKKIRIRNYLFIEDQTINFSEGMNVFIGESGVGKSLIANILLIPEKKPKKDIIGKWAEEAIIDLEVEKLDKVHHIRFVISDKLTLYLDREIVTQKKMREFWQELVDVHSQGNYQLLYESQLEIIDSFMSEAEKETKQKYLERYLEYEKIKNEIKVLEEKILKDSDQELYEYHAKEIQKISPKPNEDDELFLTLKQIRNRLDFEKSLAKIKHGLEKAGEGLKVAFYEAHALTEQGFLNKELSEKINEISAIQEDLLWEIIKTGDNDRIEDVNDIEDRLSALESLKTKFKKNLEEVINYYETIKDLLDNRDYYSAKLAKKKNELQAEKEKLVPYADALTAVRKVVLEKVLTDIRESLHLLKLDRTELGYSLHKKDSFDVSGNDELELLIKVNVGSGFVRLNELSGGETSRVMLAFKSVFLRSSLIGTYVFDEIDSGVSGDIAFKVMDLMRKMSESKQLIIITHLPMVAVNADVLFKIEKTFKLQQTVIEVEKYSTQQDIFNQVSILVTDRSSEEAKAYVRSLVRKR